MGKGAPCHSIYNDPTEAHDRVGVPEKLPVPSPKPKGWSWNDDCVDGRNPAPVDIPVFIGFFYTSQVVQDFVQHFHDRKLKMENDKEKLKEEMARH